MADSSKYYTAKTGINKGTTYTSFDVYKSYNKDYLDPVESVPTATPTTTMPTAASPASTFKGTLPSGESASFLSEDIAKSYGATLGATPKAVDTSRPSPEKVSATPYTSSSFYLPETAMEGFDPSTVFNDKGEGLDYEKFIAQGGRADMSNVKKVSNLQQGLAAAKRSGIRPPQDGGMARGLVQGFSPESNTLDLAGLSMTLEGDSGYQQLLQSQKDFYDVINQRQSLTDEYKGMIKESGIEEINTELLNAKNVIEGSEDGIRTEVTKAGGFATESQVQALTQSRNKVLIKNYNNLLETKQNAMEMVNTMIGLAGKDRDFAMQAINQKMQIDKQIMDYRDKMRQNAVDQLRYVTDKMGFDGLYSQTGGDPYYVALVEKAMGLNSGGLYQLAEQAAEERYMKQQEQQLDMEYKRAQIDKFGYDREMDNERFDLDVAKHNLEVEKFNSGGDIKTSWQDVNGDGVKELVDDSTGEVLKGADIDDDFVPEDVKTKLQSSSEYKTIGGLLPAVQTIKKYQDMIQKHGSWSSNGAVKGEIQSAYGNAIVAWKSLAALGALSGQDFELAESAIPAPGFWKRNAPIEGKLKGSLENAVTQAETLTKRLQQLYPQAKSLLETQLDDVRVQSYPDKFKRGPDGKVYEITGKSSFNSAGNASASKMSFGQIFNNAQKYFGSPLWDKGLDYVVKRGTEIPSFASGMVEKAGMEKGWGNTVMVNLGNGIKARFSHLDKILVKPGQKIDSRMLIGTVGNTGNVLKSDGTKPTAKELAAGRGTHLDLTLYKDGKPMTAKEVDKYVRSLG